MWTYPKFCIFSTWIIVKVLLPPVPMRYSMQRRRRKTFHIFSSAHRQRYEVLASVIGPTWGWLVPAHARTCKTRAWGHTRVLSPRAPLQAPAGGLPRRPGVVEFTPRKQAHILTLKPVCHSANRVDLQLLITFPSWNISMNKIKYGSSTALIERNSYYYYYYYKKMQSFFKKEKE